MTDQTGESRAHPVVDLSDVILRANQYRTLAIRKDNAHYAMSSGFQRRNKVLGIPAIVLSAMVSTAIFGSLANDGAAGWKILTGLVSVTAAVFAALQTFFNYAERATQHQVAARGYSSLRRRLEQFLLEHVETPGDRRAALEGLGAIVDEMTKIEEIEPLITDRVYERISRKYAAEPT